MKMSFLKAMKNRDTRLGSESNITHASQGDSQSSTIEPP